MKEWKARPHVSKIADANANNLHKVIPIMLYFDENLISPAWINGINLPVMLGNTLDVIAESFCGCYHCKLLLWRC